MGRQKPLQSVIGDGEMKITCDLWFLSCAHTMHMFYTVERMRLHKADAPAAA